MTSLDTIQRALTVSKRVLVVGLGVGGIASAHALKQRGVEVVISERRQRESFWKEGRVSPALEQLEREGVSVVFGVDGERLAPHLVGVGLVVMSPGVSVESAAVGVVKRLQIPFISELELGIALHEGQVVLVSGSTGKSTTAALVDHMLRRAGLNTILSKDGHVARFEKNHATPSDASRDTILIVQASSFQLEVSTHLKPNISVVLNSSEVHLERHGSSERYANAIGIALRLQDGEDLAVINADDPAVLAVAKKSRAPCALFGEHVKGEGAAISARIVSPTGGDPAVVLSFNGLTEEYSLRDTRLLGSHNRYNMAAAIVVARRLGASVAAVQATVNEFAPLEHRLEPVVIDERCAVINDSKSTSVASALAAFNTVTGQYAQRPVVLLIGGLSKAGSWDPLLSKVVEKGGDVATVICFGKDASLLASHCRAAGVPHRTSPSLCDATREALKMVAGGGAVLLSPGCSSFDEFSDFEERGTVFKRCVQNEMSKRMSLSP